VIHLELETAMHRTGLEEEELTIIAQEIIKNHRYLSIEDQHLSTTIQKQQLFWIGNHFEADVRQNFADTLSKAIEQGYTKEMLADTLKQQFGVIADKSSHYWQGLLHITGTPNSFGW
jgi:hypothetical protein